MKSFDLEKWSHRAMPMYMGGLVATGPMAFLPNTWWSRALNVGIILPILGLVILAQLHNAHSFCEYCAAKTPLDPATACHKKRRSLRFYHQFTSVWGLAYLGLLIALPMILPRVWPSFIAWAVLVPGFLWMIWAMRVHDLLKPWCPWCQHGGWNDDLVEDSPQPTHGRPLPVNGE